MPILDGSRYVGVAFTGIKGRDGVTRKYLHDRKILSKNDLGDEMYAHTVLSGQLLDSIAEDLLGRQELGWVLADINDIFFSLDLEAGTTIWIPTEVGLRRLGIDPGN